jgi:hypothetical protein
VERTTVVNFYKHISCHNDIFISYDFLSVSHSAASPNVSQMLSRYVSDASQMRPRCLPDAWQMLPKCFPNAFQMSSRCLANPSMALSFSRGGGAGGALRFGPDAFAIMSVELLLVAVNEFVTDAHCTDLHRL